ncbi:UNVERIFIED_CONTAM: hypothetical protein GTU68_022697 [Idotea baltica]|nr:hypothetical protein [Idotea baltica]
MSKSISDLQKIYSDALSEYKLPTVTPNLYEPVEYLLGLGGKRIRPVLVLAGYNMYGEDLKVATGMAHAVEYFHNFSLMHDDIMDEADLRRGKETVHKKYDINTAILSGDVMLIKAYEFIEQYPAELQVALFKLFNQTSVKICEGQQMDIDFETRDNVSIVEYLEMITNKTAVLLGAALQFGGMIGGASSEDGDHLYGFGKYMGIAFQVQDDLLDVFASTLDSGKVEGGDILQKKKTYLYLKSLELLGEEDAKRLTFLFSDQDEVQGDALVKEGRALMEDCHVKVYAQELKENYQQLAFSHLQSVSVAEIKKEELKTFAQALLNRSH